MVLYYEILYISDIFFFFFNSHKRQNTQQFKKMHFYYEICFDFQTITNFWQILNGLKGFSYFDTIFKVYTCKLYHMNCGIICSFEMVISKKMSIFLRESQTNSLNWLKWSIFIFAAERVHYINLRCWNINLINFYVFENTIKKLRGGKKSPTN